MLDAKLVASDYKLLTMKNTKTLKRNDTKTGKVISEVKNVPRSQNIQTNKVSVVKPNATTKIVKPESVTTTVGKDIRRDVEIKDTVDKMLDGPKTISPIKKAKKSKIHLCPYTEQLLSPFEFHATQIPDQNTFPSCTMDIINRSSITNTAIDGNPTAAFCLGSWYTDTASYSLGYKGGNILPCYPNAISTSSPGVVSSLVFGTVFNNPDCNDTYFGTSDSGVTVYPMTAGGLIHADDPLTLFAKANVLMWRVTKASMKVWAAGPALTQQGNYVACSFPNQGMNTNGATGGINYTNLLNSPGAQVAPVSGGNCIQVNWAPTDLSDTFYYDPSEIHQSNTTVGNQGWKANMGELWIAANGLQFGEVLWCETIIGIEFIPSQAIVQFIASSPSFADTEDMDQMWNAVVAAPKVFEGVPLEGTFHEEDSEISLPPKLRGSAKVTKDNLHLVKHVNNGANYYAVRLGDNKVSRFLRDTRDVIKEGRSVIDEVLDALKSYAKYL